MAIERYDHIVVGSGLAGLAFALDVSASGTVAVITKADVTDTNTSYAQGGIAAAVGEADSWKLHEADTLKAGAGLCDPKAVRFLVRHAPEAIAWLESWGTRFDKGVGPQKLALGREGGHSRNRIVHAADRTGAEMERAVSDAVRRSPNITVHDHVFAYGLVIQGGRCAGLHAMVEGFGPRTFLGRSVMIATGGCGRVYQHTTNPPVATGDGLALASEAGAAIMDMEFMQFHPTTLYHPQMRSFLISEAVRGAGATLRNHLGERFMYDYDPALELAPRDIVARAIDAEIRRLGTWCVYLDAAHLPLRALTSEFPTIYERLASIGIAMHKNWIPVVPAQHYSCGGIVTDLSGRSSIRGLYAAGEVARTGVHGANRLASNSLLEAVVFGSAAARAAADEPELSGLKAIDADPPKCISENAAIKIRRAVQKTMTESAGIVRSNAGLRTAKEDIARLQGEYDQRPSAPFSAYSLETRNIVRVAELVVDAALARSENVGLHYNVDLVTDTTRSSEEVG